MNHSADHPQKSHIHPTACIEPEVTIGEGASIWHFVQIRKGARIGDLVSVGKDSYIDSNVKIGKGSRIQNQVNIYDGVTIGDWCFIGPAVVFTNDQFPRVGNKTWRKIPTIIHNGASIGAGAVIRCGIQIGAFSMVAAGALVTKDVPPFTLFLGHPAEGTKRVCACGQSVLPLTTPPSEFLRDCCSENMMIETFELAINELRKYVPN